MNPPTIAVVGSINVDLVARVPRIPAPGETLLGSDLVTTFGGKGANQAVMAARLGAHVFMVGKIGADSFGSDVLANFAREGVDTTYCLTTDRPTGVALISVAESTGQNTIVVTPGANAAVTPEAVRAAHLAIEAAGAVMCQLEIPTSATLEAFRMARAKSVPAVTIFNPAPAVAFPPELLPLCDVILPNEHEAAQIAGMPPIHSIEDAVTVGKALQQRGVKNVVITLGSRGALLIDEAGETAHLPAEKVEAVDTVGAGDAFAGSLAFFAAAGFDLRDSIRRAVAIATLSVLKPGAMASFPFAREIQHLLSNN